MPEEQVPIENPDPGNTDPSEMVEDFSPEEAAELDRRLTAAMTELEGGA